MLKRLFFILISFAIFALSCYLITPANATPRTNTTSEASSDSNSTSDSTSKSNSRSKATGGDASSRSTSKAKGGNSASEANGEQSVVITQEKPKIPVSTAVAPSFHSSGSDVCSGGVSGGAQGTGFGVSFGTTVTDEHCMALRAAVRLRELGFTNTAAARLCQVPEIAQAFKDSGEFVCIDRSKPVFQVDNSN